MHRFWFEKPSYVFFGIIYEKIRRDYGKRIKSFKINEKGG
jgi:hypothetical protein